MICRTEFKKIKKTEKQNFHINGLTKKYASYNPPKPEDMSKNSPQENVANTYQNSVYGPSVQYPVLLRKKPIISEVIKTLRRCKGICNIVEKKQKKS